jgi:thioredoxin 2
MDAQHHVACPHCDAINRIPSQRLGDAPKCGKCSKPLFEGAPFALTDSNFPAHIERSSLPVLVDFWAAWCGPCRAMAPHFEQAARQLEPNVRFAKLNTDENPRTSSRFSIRSIPTLILFRNGAEIARQAGAMDSHRLTEWLRSHL